MPQGSMGSTESCGDVLQSLSTPKDCHEHKPNTSHKCASTQESADGSAALFKLRSKSLSNLIWAREDGLGIPSHASQVSHVLHTSRTSHAQRPLGEAKCAEGPTGY